MCFSRFSEEAFQIKCSGEKEVQQQRKRRERFSCSKHKEIRLGLDLSTDENTDDTNVMQSVYDMG